MLKDLKNKYKGQKAIIIMGGPSILKNNLDLSMLNSRSDIIFAEPKTLTKKFFEFGVIPDYIFATYPEKLRTNTMQYTFLQAIASNHDLTYSIKNEFLNDWNDFLDNFGEYAEIWRINFAHKKYKIKKDVILKNSPYDLLTAYPDIPIIANSAALDRDGYNYLNLNNKVYTFDFTNKYVSKNDNIESYLNPEIKNNIVGINNINSLNSATIGIIPILNFLGFNQVCFIGKDMSMLGAMEHSCEYFFKSMRHYKNFHDAARNAFSYQYPRGFKRGVGSLIKNGFKNIYENNIINAQYNSIFKNFIDDIWGLKGKFLRKKDQFKDYDLISNKSSIDFINIFQPTKYASSVPGMKNINYKEFINNH